MCSWEDAGFVLASKYRKKIIELLALNPKTPSDMVKESGIRFSHVSRALNELKNKGLVECLTPNRLKGKIYGLTIKGHEVYRKIHSSKAKRNE